YADYKKLFFGKLPKKLAFYKKQIDIQIEENNLLPAQTVGNCSFVSPITSVFAYRLLGEVHGIDQKGRLLKKDLEVPLINPTLSESDELPPETSGNLVISIEKAQTWYQTWVTFEEMTILERLIQPLQNKTNVFEPDHAIILKAFRKAHLLPLDNLGIQKLDALTQIYSNFLDEKERTQFKSDIVYCKTLARTPLL
ncbi:MAG TPA: hypothetical protein VGP47_09095, partial [Parachlamydiaceae bacterium]|nr:hypothetical protein [Parachlamydiaceae bacterium]